MHPNLNEIVYLNRTIITERQTRAKMCLRDLQQWPGCEGVREVSIFGGKNGTFQVRVKDYGLVRKRLADRAALCVEREKRRYYCLVDVSEAYAMEMFVSDLY